MGLCAAACSGPAFTTSSPPDDAGVEGGGGSGTSGTQGPPGCATAQLSPVAGTTIDQEHPDAHLNDQNFYHVERSSVGTSARALIAFDIGKIRAGATLRSAGLELLVRGAPASSANIEVHRVQQSPARPWKEDHATWNDFDEGHAWTAAGGDFYPVATAVQAISAGGLGLVYRWDVLADVQSFYADGTANFGWLLKDAAEPAQGGGEYVDFASYRAAEVESRPKLIIEYCLE